MEEFLGNVSDVLTAMPEFALFGALFLGGAFLGIFLFVFGVFSRSKFSKSALFIVTQDTAFGLCYSGIFGVCLAGNELTSFKVTILISLFGGFLVAVLIWFLENQQKKAHI